MYRELVKIYPKRGRERPTLNTLFEFNEKVELTRLMYEMFGWCLTGMKSSHSRSKNWMLLSEETPMYRKTPKMTELGTSRSNGDRRTESPTSMATQKPVTR